MCKHIYVRIKNSTQITNRFIKNWYYYTIYGNTRNRDIRPHLWGTPDQNLCLGCIQFQFILRHPCIDVSEAVFQLSYTFVDYTLIESFDRDLEFVYHSHKHGVLDHAFLSVFLRVGGKSGRAEGPTLIRVVQTIGVSVLWRVNNLSELEEYGHQDMNGTIHVYHYTY